MIHHLKGIKNNLISFNLPDKLLSHMLTMMTALMLMDQETLSVMSWSAPEKVIFLDNLFIQNTFTIWPMFFFPKVVRILAKEIAVAQWPTWEPTSVLFHGDMDVLAQPTLVCAFLWFYSKNNMEPIIYLIFPSLQVCMLKLMLSWISSPPTPTKLSIKNLSSKW